MPANFTTRRFKSTDADAVVKLWTNALPSSQPWNEPRHVLIRKLNTKDNLVFVAERDHQIVGAVIAGYDGVRGWIYSLAVSPDHRRIGVGCQLLLEAESALLSLGCPKINLQVRSTNSQVLEFYRRCGYALEDRLSFGKPLDGNLRRPADPVPRLQVTDTITLSQITFDDKTSYLTHLNETASLQNQTACMPYPYTEFDADQWLCRIMQETLARDRSRNWAIRGDNGRLIGGIGLIDITSGEKAEIGYWLARPYWGQEIMTRTVKRLCAFACEQYRLRKLQASVFATNPRSRRVLEKAEFELEGTLRNHFFRDGQTFDVLLFGLHRD